MNTDAMLKSKIFELTRGELEQSIFPFPSLWTSIETMNIVHIGRISRFWKERECEKRPLLESVEDLISGFYGQSCSWMFLLKGSPNDIECWHGIDRKFADKSSLRSILCGAFPDIRFKPTNTLNKDDIDRLKYAHIVTGTPSPKTGDQIEKICRGFYGSPWLYTVYAKPIPAADIVKALNDVAEQIRHVYTTYLLKTSPTDEQNRLAKVYVDLLEAKLRRLEQGRTFGMWDVQTIFMTNDQSLMVRARALLQSAFSGEKSVPDPIRVRPCSGTCQSPCLESPRLEPLTSLEVAVLARPPSEEYPGYEVVDYIRFGAGTNGAYPQNMKTINIGTIFDRGIQTGNSLRIPLRNLTKHCSIAGVTGSGKTNTYLTLLDQIWDGGKGVPFLVIEPAKSEYRTLLRNARFKGLNIFTVGDETTSPLRLNPFEVPKGLLIQTHIDYLKSLFSAAFVLYPPMPYVLEQSLQEIYEDRGWDLIKNINSRGEDSVRLFPILTDLAAKVGVVVDRMGYDEHITMDVKAGLLARINQLRLGGGKGPMFNTRKSLSSAVLFGSPCILELKQIVSDDEKAFIMGLILIRLYEYWEAQPTSPTGDLRHVTLIEEAHRLLRNVSTEQGSEVVANPKGRAIEVFTNILSEIRAFGEGIFIAEQIPVKLTPDAIKNTNLKIAHRLLAEDDRQAMGNTMNLCKSQLRYLTTLQPGEAVAYAEGMQKPVLLTIPLFHTKENSGIVSTQEVKNTMDSFWQQNHDLRISFKGCTLCPIPDYRQCRRTIVVDRADTLLLESFEQLFNTLRLNKALVLDAYSDFVLSFKRSPARICEANSSYCIFVALIDSYMERRGEFWNWSHNDVEEVIWLSCSIMAHITQVKVIEKKCEIELNALSDLLRRLHHVANLPFAGCHLCSDQCMYRFDTIYPNYDLNVTIFRSTFRDIDKSIDDIARICWNTSTTVLLTKDIKSRMGMALCFAIQQFSELGLPRLDQEDMSRQVAECLKRIGGK